MGCGLQQLTLLLPTEASASCSYFIFTQPDSLLGPVLSTHKGKFCHTVAIGFGFSTTVKL